MTKDISLSMLGPPIDLMPRSDPADLADWTLKVRIADVGPRRIKLAAPPKWRRGEAKSLGDVTASVQEFDMEPFPSPTTRLDLNATMGDKLLYKCIAFQLEGPGLTFMTKKFVSGGEEDAVKYLFEPRLITPTLATMIVGKQIVPPTSYALGIDVQDEDDPTMVTPIFIDPKVRNDG